MVQEFCSGFAVEYPAKHQESLTPALRARGAPIAVSYLNTPEPRTELHEEQPAFGDEFLLSMTDDFSPAYDEWSNRKMPFHVCVSLYGHVTQRRFRDAEFQVNLQFLGIKKPPLPVSSLYDYIYLASSHNRRARVTDLASLKLLLSVEYTSSDAKTGPEEKREEIAFRIAMGGDVRAEKIVSIEEQTEINEDDEDKRTLIINIIPNPTRQLLSSINVKWNIPQLPSELLCQIFDFVDEDFEGDEVGKIENPLLYNAVFTSFALVNRAWGAVVKEWDFFPAGTQGCRRGEISRMQDLGYLNLASLVLEVNWPTVNNILKKGSRIEVVSLNVPPPEDFKEWLGLINVLTAPHLINQITSFSVDNGRSAFGKRQWGWDFIFRWLQAKSLVSNGADELNLFLHHITTDTVSLSSNSPAFTSFPCPFSYPWCLHLVSCYVSVSILLNLIPPGSQLGEFWLSLSWNWDGDGNTQTLLLEVLSKVRVQELMFNGTLLEDVSAIDNPTDDVYFPTGTQFSPNALSQVLSSHPELKSLQINGGTEARCCVSPAAIEGLARLRNLRSLRLLWCIDIDNTNADDFISHLSQPCNTSFSQLSDLALSVLWSEEDQKLLENACKNHKCTCEELGCLCFGPTEGQAKTWVCVCEQDETTCSDRRCRCRHQGETKCLADEEKEVFLEMVDVDDSDI